MLTAIGLLLGVFGVITPIYFLKKLIILIVLVIVVLFLIKSLTKRRRKKQFIKEINEIKTNTDESPKELDSFKKL